MSRTHHYWYITRGVSTVHDLLTVDIDVVFTFKFSYAKFLGGRCLETFQFLYCCNKPIWCKEKICYVIIKTRSGTNQSIEFRRRGAQEWRCTGVRRTWHVTHTLTSPDVPTHTRWNYTILGKSILVKIVCFLNLILWFKQTLKGHQFSHFYGYWEYNFLCLLDNFGNILVMQKKHRFWIIIRLLYFNRANRQPVEYV